MELCLSDEFMIGVKFLLVKVHEIVTGAKVRG